MIRCRCGILTNYGLTCSRCSELHNFKEDFSYSEEIEFEDVEWQDEAEEGAEESERDRDQ